MESVSQAPSQLGCFRDIIEIEAGSCKELPVFTCGIIWKVKCFAREAGWCVFAEG